jgi:hypothetical protein
VLEQNEYNQKTVPFRYFYQYIKMPYARTLPETIPKTENYFSSVSLDFLFYSLFFKIYKKRRVEYNEHRIDINTNVFSRRRRLTPLLSQKLINTHDISFLNKIYRFHIIVCKYNILQIKKYTTRDMIINYLSSQNEKIECFCKFSSW